MKNPLLIASTLALTGLGLVLAAAPAQARTDVQFQVHIGVPGVLYPAPVVVPPPVVYYPRVVYRPYVAHPPAYRYYHEHWRAPYPSHPGHGYGRPWNDREHAGFRDRR